MTDSSGNIDAFEALVDQARAGDSDAQSAVLTRIEPVVRGFFIRRIGRQNASIDDLVQNTLMRVFRSFADLKESSRLQAFAMKAALFELQDLFRGRYSMRESAWDQEAEDPASLSGSEGLRIDIERALDTLTPKARRIIELKVLGYRYEEIAGMIESTEAAVKMQVKRALERLRDELGLASYIMLCLLTGTGP
jgi:RNA polymerase sigma-70 factor (ECF subfamily)